jgi:Uroporphyrinogen decarboxylase (URO-D)
MDICVNQLADQYQRRSEQRLAKLNSFFGSTHGGFLILQRPPMSLWGTCNDVETIYRNNIDAMDAWLAVEATDELPYLEPWIGTGIYANAFGCEYVWRDNDAPAVHYRYHRIDEVRGITKPDWRATSPIMRMVLDCIDRLKEGTQSRFPIALTDTQSPYDTATLILDACELFACCYEEPETVRHFMQQITDLLIEFSREQIRHIGDNLVARPGHIMTGVPGGRGISISDDNLAVGSPKVNLDISMPFNQQIADAFGGVAIHSCGCWTGTMKHLSRFPGVFMVDCAGERVCDPNPNTVEAIRDAMAGQGIITKVRFGANMETAIPAIRQLADKRLRLVIDIGYDAPNAQRNYDLVRRTLEEAYA